MLESSKKDRIKFSRKGTQRSFILKAKNVLDITGLELADKLGVSQRTITDWVSEKFNMSYCCAKQLSKLSKVIIPKNHSIILWKNHMREIGKVGGKNRVALYGKVTLNEKYRADKWNKWWNEIGINKDRPSGFQSIIKIKIPEKNKKLAEFVGIMLGDGGVAPYHIHITLSDKEKIYAKYIMDLIRDLFGVSAKLNKLKNSNAVDIVVQRKQLVDFCQDIGLVLGNKVKHQVDVPIWIKEDREFVKMCIRGLIDTDGCFYTNSYVVNGKKYTYYKIAFTNSSKPLVDFVARNLIKLGINARIGRNHKDVRVEDVGSVYKYIKEICSSNSKHLKKIKYWRRVRAVE